MRIRTLCLCGLFLAFQGCANVQESKLVPVMGMNEVLEEEEENSAAVDVQADASATATADSDDVLEQTLLFMPFRDLSKYKGPWNIHVEAARGLTDSLKSLSALNTVPVDSALVHLSKNELKGKIALEKGLKVGRDLGADYVVFGEIEELSMKRFRATVPVGGYRSYQGLTTLTVRMVKVIDEQPAGELTREGSEETKRIGITNPAAFVPYEKEYFLLGQMGWGTESFHETLLGKSVGKCLGSMAVAIDSLIQPPPELTVSEPKIIDIDGAQAYINIGLADAVENGFKFGVWDNGRVLTDPQTGTVLGKALPRRVGVIQVEQVLSEHLSLVRILEGGEEINSGYDIRAE